jgi:Tfp pilus assembly protein PilN
MRSVNLLPRDVQQAGSDGGRTPLLVVGGGLAAVTAASVVMFLSVSGAVADQRAQLDAVEAAIARIPRKESPVVAPETIAQERSERTAAFSAALATRVPVDRLLRELAYVLPEDAWLTALSATVPTSTAGVPATPSSSTVQDVSIIGATYSHSSVARVLSRLAAVPSLDDVRLTGSARVVMEAPAGTTSKKPVTKEVVTFTISANLRLGRSA